MTRLLQRQMLPMTAALITVLAGCSPAATGPATSGSTASARSLALQVADYPSSPTGYRPVTFHGMTVDVPSDWTTDDTRCGQPSEPTVVRVHASVAACAVGVLPTVPSLALAALPPDGTSSPTDRGAWTETTFGSLWAERQDSAPTAESPVHRSDVVFPDRHAMLTVRAPDPAAVDDLLMTLRLDSYDVNHCRAAVDVTDPLAAGGPAGRPGAESTLIPYGSTSLVACIYGDGQIESSTVLDDATRVALTAAINAAPAGLSMADPTTYLTEGCAQGRYASTDRIVALLMVGYPDRSTLEVTARVGQCGTSGVTNGSLVHQVTSALALDLVELGGVDGAPGAFVPAG